MKNINKMLIFLQIAGILPVISIHPITHAAK